MGFPHVLDVLRTDGRFAFAHRSTGRCAAWSGRSSFPDAHSAESGASCDLLDAGASETASPRVGLGDRPAGEAVVCLATAWAPSSTEATSAPGLSSSSASPPTSCRGGEQVTCGVGPGPGGRPQEFAPRESRYCVGGRCLRNRGLRSRSGRSDLAGVSAAGRSVFWMDEPGLYQAAIDETPDTKPDHGLKPQQCYQCEADELDA